MTPGIELRGSNLHIGPHIIPLKTRNKTLLLVEAMLQDDPINKDCLRRRVYASPEPPSERLRLAQECSLNKLISRSRNFLAQSLATSELSARIQWFVYSNRERTWRLFDFYGKAQASE